MTSNSKYHSEWYAKNRERLLPIRRKYNKEYTKRPEVIEKAKIKNALPYFKQKRKVYKKTEKGRKSENNSRNRWYAKNGYNKRLWERYKITEKDYGDMFIKQNGVCAICGNPPKIKLHVDHCHNTNKIRGLLCSPCNMSLGLLKDSVEFLGKAMEYLKNNGVH